MGKPSQVSSEVRERAVRMVHEYKFVLVFGSRWEAIRSIAPKIGGTAQTLHNWLRKEEPVQIAAATEQVRLKELEREVAELHRADEILRELDTGRVDLQAVADRHVDILRTQGARARSETHSQASAARCRTARIDSTCVGAELPSLW